MKLMTCLPEPLYNRSVLIVAHVFSVGSHVLDINLRQTTCQQLHFLLSEDVDELLWDQFKESAAERIDLWANFMSHSLLRHQANIFVFVLVSDSDVSTVGNQVDNDRVTQEI
jgi:hypothetical protein